MKKFVIVAAGLILCGSVYAYQPGNRMVPAGRGGKMSTEEMERAYEQCLDACNEQSDKRNFIDCYEKCDRIFKRGKKEYMKHHKGGGRRDNGPNGYTGVKG